MKYNKEDESKQIEYTFYFYIENDECLRYLYDPDCLDINHYPCWDTLEEAQNYLKLNQTK